MIRVAWHGVQETSKSKHCRLFTGTIRKRKHNHGNMETHENENMETHEYENIESPGSATMHA